MSFEIFIKITFEQTNKNFSISSAKIKPMTEQNLKEYFKNLGCDYWHEQENAYGHINYIGKSVTIIGSDCGTTSLFVISKGATHVIAYESDENLRKKFQEEVCKKFNICDKVEQKGEWKNEYPNTDVFIMDCEGCEKQIDIEQLKKYKDWCIAVHEWTENRVELIKKLLKNIISFITDDGKEIVICKKS